MVDCYAVVGDANTGKTTTIRALTGVRRREPKWRIDYGAGGIDTYVEIEGLQEQRNPFCLPPEFIRRVSAEGVSKVIVPLRYWAVGHRPDAIVYLRAFQAAGWNVLPPVVLGKNYATGACPVGAAFSGTKYLIPQQELNGFATAPNSVAAQCRQHWGIL